MKSEEINSSEGEKPAWKRAKVCIVAASRALPSQRSIPEIHEHLWKSFHIYQKNPNTMKSSEDKKPAWNRAKDSTGAAGRFLQS